MRLCASAMTSARHISPSIASVCLSSPAPTITYPKLADYDAQFVLKSRPRSQIDGDGIALNPPSELAVKAWPAL
jgi:hypothetical protein